MAEITAGLVKELREKSGAGMMDCKKALVECNGIFEEAVDWLRTKGLSAAAKKSLSSSSSSSKPYSPTVATGAKATILVDKYIRMMVKYSRQTSNLKLVEEAVKFYDKNRIGEIYGITGDYLKSVIEDLSSSSATGAAASSDNEKLLDDLADVIIKQKNDSDANTLYPLYNMVEQGNIDDAVQYFLDNKLWDVDYKVLDIVKNNPITRSILLALEENPVAAASAAAPAPHASPKASSGAAAAASASSAPPKPMPKAGKALKVSKAASADTAGDLFLESILKDAKKHDKNEKKLKKYHRLVREGKIKEANAYSIKHKIAKIPGAFDKFESVVGPVDDGDDYVSITPPTESPVPLSPEVLKKAPLSFGQAAAMATASGTPKAKGKGKGKGAIAGTELSPLSMLHKQLVHRAVSPTFSPHDPKLAVSMG